MTTLDDVLIPESESAVAPHRSMWLPPLAAFVIGFILSLGFAGSALLAYDAQHDGRVLTGVSVAGVDLSGLDLTTATATLEQAFAGYADGHVVVETTAGPITIEYEDFDRRPDVAAMVDAAMAAGRSGTILERAVASTRLLLQPVVIEPRLTMDEVALADLIARGVAARERRPVDSTVRMVEDGSILITASRPGRTFDAAVATAAALDGVRRLDAPTEILVQAPMTSVPPAHDTGEAMLARTAAERMIGDLEVKYGKKSWRIKAATIRGWIDFERDALGVVRPVIDEAAIPKTLKKVAKGVKREALSAKYLKTRGGQIVGVVPSRDGRKLDKAATASVIAAALAVRATGGEVGSVKAKVAKVTPKLTTEEAAKRGPVMSRLGSWKTWFPISDRNYFGANIWRPAEIIDGMVLRPGQRFEWWSAIGPVTPARGYGAGGFINGSRTDPTGALGGGMCSSSTTLFNAALRAGLRMGARDNHKYYINRYPLGLDATVSKLRGGGGQTMSFTNDMDDPVVIRTFRYRAGGVGWVRYEIWGIPDGRKVTISKPRVSNVRRATTTTVSTSRLPKGVREQVEYPANGMHVSVTRVVKAKGGSVLHRDTYTTDYVLWNGRIEIGR
jgi:vancomycin resistance protein YoaR